MGKVRYETIYGLLARHFDKASKKTAGFRWELDLAGPCEAPVLREMFARPHRGAGRRAQSAEWVAFYDRLGTVEWLHYPERATIAKAGSPLWLDLWVPCRKCTRCLLIRGAQWEHRAKTEWKQSERTWFCTFTLSPDEHYKSKLIACERLAKKGLLFESLSAADQFAERVKSITPAFTKYLKRVRKVTFAPIRYLLVAEYHQSGLPHFHALLHEQDATRPVRKRVLKEQWKLGFSTFKIVEGERQIEYVCKYISKGIEARVRASIHYGNEVDHALSITKPNGGVCTPDPLEKVSKETKTETAGAKQRSVAEFIS